MALEISQPGYVLHQRAYRETSALVTFLTPQQGKVTAVVRGLRSGRKNGAGRRALCQPFQPLHLSWREGRRDLVNLAGMEAAGIRFPLFGEAGFCGLYVNELIYRLLYPGVAVDPFFQAYEQTLYQLADAENRADQAWQLRQFEWVLLDTLGVRINFTETVDAEPISASGHYAFRAGVGFAPVGQTSAERALPGRCLQAFSQGQYDPQCLSVWRFVFRQAIDQALGGQPIQARALFTPNSYQD
ncbi:MAG: DNA repair protein RecO [Hydrogenovibrio sp.]|uniref:DNA repair protein RecO n=1 Tax=Hydrogenovibrio sp. TaxID=2065821 RepID=UPI0028702996|nr:DNA repair protein RecO [Hydrogenovibrio sp.]MDR9499450.1 DNA repair protein RecO [Hydrogenovibrio sp.]